MVSTQWLFVAALTGIIALHAVLRGANPERYCAAIIVLGIVIDKSLDLTIGQRSFSQFDITRVVLDLAQFGLFLAVALRANRTYPLAIVSAQLMALIGSLAALFVSGGWNQAYWAMTQLPVFLELLFLAAGTYAHSRREARVGRYNCWSPQPVTGISAQH